MSDQCDKQFRYLKSDPKQNVSEAPVEQLTDAMTEDNNVIPSNEEDLNASDNKVYMDEDGHGKQDGRNGEAHDDGNGQPQATTVVVAPTARPQRSISRRL